MFVLDASALASLFAADAHSERAIGWMETATGRVILTDFAAAELAAALTKAERTQRAAPADIDQSFDDFDIWRAGTPIRRTLGSADIALAEGMVRDRRTKLAAADATYIAVASNDGATLVTFDLRQAQAAALLGVACVVPAAL